MIGYDVECYPNFFCVTFISLETNRAYYYEISQRVNHINELTVFAKALYDQQLHGIGYNSLEYDYPLIHFILQGNRTPEDIYKESCRIFSSRWNSIKKPHFPQIDLMAIMGYSGKARACSLKQLEFVMRSENIQDLPIAPGTWLTFEQMDQIRYYNYNDVVETIKFYYLIKEHVDYRLELNDPYLLNAVDTKIGESIVINRIGREYFYQHGEKIQTPRTSIDLNECINPIEFENIELKKVYAYFKSQTITETKGIFKGLNAVVNGFQLDFGLGGIHGSRHRESFKSDSKYLIIDVDVTSYYPSLIINNMIEPAHVKGRFIPVYREIKADRLLYKKGTMKNKLYKDALNGTFGRLNDKYSPLLDPVACMKTTLNGQLAICKLIEDVYKIRQVEALQANTDGVTFMVRRTKLDKFLEVCKQWELKTGLQLERVDYSRMWIRDVNNYIAEYQGTDKLKLKGTYDTDKEYHKDHSKMIVAKAAVDHMVKGVHFGNTLMACRDPYDFCNFAKGQAALKVNDRLIQRRSRYYVSKLGGKLKKVFRDGRETGICTDYVVAECNDIRNFDFNNLNYGYYAEEIKKVLIQ